MCSNLSESLMLGARKKQEIFVILILICRIQKSFCLARDFRQPCSTFTFNKFARIDFSMIFSPHINFIGWNRDQRRAMWYLHETWRIGWSFLCRRIVWRRQKCAASFGVLSYSLLRKCWSSWIRIRNLDHSVSWSLLSSSSLGSVWVSDCVSVFLFRGISRLINLIPEKNSERIRLIIFFRYHCNRSICTKIAPRTA